MPVHACIRVLCALPVAAGACGRADLGSSGAFTSEPIREPLFHTGTLLPPLVLFRAQLCTLVRERQRQLAAEHRRSVLRELCGVQHGRPRVRARCSEFALHWCSAYMHRTGACIYARARARPRPHTSSVHWDWPPKSESAAVRNDASRRSAPSSWNENHTRSRSTDMSHENAWRAIGASCEIHAPGPEEASRRGVAPSGDAAAAARRAGTSHRRVRAAAAARPAARRSIVSVMPPHSRRGLGVA